MAATNTNCLVGALVACIILLVLSLNISRGGRMPSRNEFVNSMPTLTSWVQDLVDRLSFMSGWVDNGTPCTYWLSCYFFPQAGPQLLTLISLTPSPPPPLTYLPPGSAMGVF